jgi:hypothetical protein
MRDELSISILDLRFILINLTKGLSHFNIKLNNKKEILQSFRLTEFDPEGNVSFYKDKGAECIQQVSLCEIEYIEFELFYQYRDQVAKIFRVRYASLADLYEYDITWSVFSVFEDLVWAQIF